MVFNLIVSQILSCIIDDGLMTMVVIDDGTMLGVSGGVVYKKLGRRQVPSLCQSNLQLIIYMYISNQRSNGYLVLDLIPTPTLVNTKSTNKIFGCFQNFHQKTKLNSSESQL